MEPVYGTSIDDLQSYSLYTMEDANSSNIMDDSKRMTTKRSSHNEAEKRRIKTINKYIDDLRGILDKAAIPHKSDKVATLEATVTYMKSLLKERDRLTTALGYMDSILPGTEGADGSSSDEEAYSHIYPSPFSEENIIISKRDTDPNRYEGHSLAKRILEGEGEEVSQEMPPPTSSLKKEKEINVKKETIESSVIDYKRVWMHNNIATLVVHIETGQILKGNHTFMKMFQFTSMEELTQYSLFDIIVVNDLSLFWSEYSQLVNCNRQIIRSFVVSITNPQRSLCIPCLITMGPIMDYEGFVFQVSVSFTPLKEIQTNDDLRVVDTMGKKAVTLEKIV